jgi:hypothetical protein
MTTQFLFWGDLKLFYVVYTMDPVNPPLHTTIQIPDLTTSFLNEEINVDEMRENQKNLVYCIGILLLLLGIGVIFYYFTRVMGRKN